MVTMMRVRLWIPILVLAVFTVAGCSKKQQAKDEKDLSQYKVSRSGEEIEPIQDIGSSLSSTSVDGSGTEGYDLFAMSGTDSAEPIRDMTLGDKQRIPELQNVYFDYDQSLIREDQMVILLDNLSYIQSNDAVQVEIQGHCDEMGTEQYNLALGDRRAQAIRGFFIENGIQPGRLTTVSYGEEIPAVEGETPDAHSMNRRAEFWVKM